MTEGPPTPVTISIHINHYVHFPTIRGCVVQNLYRWKRLPEEFVMDKKKK